MASAAEPRTVEGRVVDEKGKPVSGASVDFFWRANGPYPKEDVEKIPKAEVSKLLWGHLGQMEPFRTVKSDADGHFKIEISERFYTLMAMDAERRRGGLVHVPKQVDGVQLDIHLQRLVRVTDRFEGSEPGKHPGWAHVCTLAPDDPTRPLSTNRLVNCGSEEARFAMSLLPGRYTLDANDDGAHSAFEMEIQLKADKPEVDLGTLKFARVTRQNINEKIKNSHVNGTMGDYKKHYGEKLPAWHVVDARGVNKNVQLSDFKGKWVFVKFWALNCGSCLRTDLPNLSKFYREYHDRRDQFEILAICVDCVKYEWGGKPLPFPVLLDPSMTTLERYGVPGYEALLVDPSGKLVEGDETTLKDKLRK